MTASWAIAAGDAITAEAGAAILREGGNAVDAVIAAAMAACVVEPALASPFGGGFMMVREPEGRARLLDFFVQTPRRRLPEAEAPLIAVEADFGETRQVFRIGPASIAAPGVGPGLAEAHRVFGRAPMRVLVAPAAAAGKGFALDAFQAEVAQIIACILGWSPEGRALLGFEGDAPPKPGAALRNPALADLWEEFAREGARFLTEGEPAAALAMTAREGGHLSAADIAGFAPVWREPEMVARGRARIALNPPPSTGGPLIGFGLALLDPAPAPAVIAAVLTQTLRARLESGLDADAAAGAAQLGDPGFVARFRRESLAAPLAARGTTHISALDAQGMGAALTLSNGAGSGLIVPGTGAMANNMLGEADLVREPGLWPQDRRLSSMMAPSVVDWPDGRFAMLGSGGSNRIRSALLQVMLHVIDGGARLEDAVAAPRMHVENWPGPELDFEDRFPEADRAALLALFPEARAWPRDSMFYGGVHGVIRDARGGVEAAGDHRRAGVAITG